MDAPLLDTSVEEPRSHKAPGFTVPQMKPLLGKNDSLIETGLMATLLRIRLPKLDSNVQKKNTRIAIVGLLGLLSPRLADQVEGASASRFAFPIVIAIIFFTPLGSILGSLSLGLTELLLGPL